MPIPILDDDEYGWRVISGGVKKGEKWMFRYPTGLDVE
jgi:hypothetical protein